MESTWVWSNGPPLVMIQMVLKSVKLKITEKSSDTIRIGRTSGAMM